MGCCASTNTAAPPPKTENNGGSKSPPPVDEETVKQVLSETKLSSPPIPRFHLSERMIRSGGGAAFNKDDPSDVVSEIHSTHSESISTRNDAAFRRPGEKAAAAAAPRLPAWMCDTSPGRFNPGSGYIKKPVVGESSRSRKKGIYQDRVGSGSGDRIRKGEGKEREELARPPTPNIELLENSLVSLECFIFL